MFDELSQGDQEQIFLRNVLMWEGKIVHVEQIVAGVYSLFDLREQKSLPPQAKAYQKFTPIYKRVGLITIGNEVVLAARTPQRLMSFGFTTENMSFKPVDSGARHLMVGARNNDLLRPGVILRSKAFAKSLLGEYPSLKEAVSVAETLGQPVAFDRQFGINPDRSVFFKGHRVVGHLKPERVGVQSIVFDEEWKYLKLLLEKTNGKDFRTVDKKERIW